MANDKAEGDENEGHFKSTMRDFLWSLSFRIARR